MSLQLLLTKWMHNHWSLLPPESYRIDFHGREFGIGVIAHKNMAAFNLAWGMCGGALISPQDHMAACRHFDVYCEVLKYPINGHPLQEWVSMFQPVELLEWLEKEVTDRSIRKFIIPPTRRAVYLQAKTHDLR